MQTMTVLSAEQSPAGVSSSLCPSFPRIENRVVHPLGVASPVSVEISLEIPSAGVLCGGPFQPLVG